MSAPPEQYRRRNRVVDHGYALLVGDTSQLLYIADVTCRIADALTKKALVSSSISF
jgi:hypothetical protein